MTAAKTTTSKPTGVTTKPDGTITFPLTLTKDAVATEYQHVLREVATTIELKGFRKGKAPLNMVERSVDKNKLYSHVLEHALPPVYAKVVAENKLQPLVEPRITPKTMEEGKDWEFDVEVAGKPEVALGDYEKYLKGLKVEVKDDKKDKADDAKLTAVFDALLKNAKIDVAPLLVDIEARSALSKLVNQLSSLQLSVQDYAKSIKKTEEELVKEYQTTALTNLRLEFILDALVSARSPEVKETEPRAKYAAQRKAVLDYLLAL